MNPRRPITSGAALAAALLALAATPAPARNPNYRFVFPSPPGGAFNSVPAVDGVVVGDLGWTGAFRYVFENGTNVPDAIIQGIKDNSHLYLSIEVTAGPDWDDDTAVVLAFDPDGNPANGRRIDIFPVNTGSQPVNGKNLNPRQVVYWTNSATWNNAGGLVNPSSPTHWANLANNNIKVSSPSQGVWAIEVRIPINTAAANQANDSGINFPPAADFGLFVNVAQVNAQAGTVTMRAWQPELEPTGPQGIADVSLDSTTPDPSVWGNAARGGAAGKGIAFSWNDINSNQNPTSQINLNGPNVFSALIHNTTVNAAGSPIAAPPITATFKIADFGLATNWNVIVVAGNPTAAAGISPGSTQLFSTGQWNLTPQQKTFYQAHPHQCILVELQETAPGTLFVNKSTSRNMDFVSMQGFNRSPGFGIRGLGLPPGATVHEFVVRETEVHMPPNVHWQAALEGQGVTSIGRGQFVVKVDPRLGRDVHLNNRVVPPLIQRVTSPVFIPPGAFGSIAHAGLPAGVTPVRVAVQPASVVSFTPRASLPPHAAAPAAAAGVATHGTLVGSFDHFRTTFSIGDGATLHVPAGVSALELAVNRPAGAPASPAAAGLNVDIERLSPDVLAGLHGGGVFRDPGRIILPHLFYRPSLVYRGVHKTGKTIRIRDRRYVLAENVGGFGYILTP